MSNVVEPQITETKPSAFGNFIKSNPKLINDLLSGGFPYQNEPPRKPINPIEGGQAFLDRQNEIARQQAIMEEMAYNNRLTDKVFGKEGGWSFERPIKLGAYIILGAVVGRYVAKNMKKSTTLGMVVGGLAPLLALKLTMEYDKKNMPKQEPKQKVAIEPTPMPNKKFGGQMAFDLKGGCTSTL